MKQQFIGLFHCKCGLSWKRDIGFFERTPNMVFALERIQAGKKVNEPLFYRKAGLIVCGKPCDKGLSASCIS